jgi:hypothetical protein
VIVDDRNAAVRVHRPELGRVEAAEPAAGLDVAMRQRKLADEPHDLLQVERAAPSPDREHRNECLRQLAKRSGSCPFGHSP